MVACKGIRKVERMSMKLPEEWFKQAEYDYVTAEAMLNTGR